MLAAAGNRICRKFVEKCCFATISDDTLGSFWARFWNLLALQRHGVSLPGGDFFEAVLLLAAAGNRICRKSVVKCCFSRISDDTLGSFLARFWNLLVLQRHGVSLPGGDFFEAVLLLAAAGNRICRKFVEKCCFATISDDRLGNFLARFWNLLVLQRHGVSLPGGDFFGAVLLLAAAGNRICRKMLFF